MSKKLWFTPDKVFSYNAMLNFVVGARGCGKTYGTKKWAIKRFLKTGEKFIYLRRYKDELKDLDKFFDTLQYDKELSAHEFKVQGRRFFIDKMECGKADCLSQGQSKKSVEEPKTNCIIFDEFIVEKGYIHYLPNEVNQLYNYMHSVFRNRDNCRCICLANSISWVNPYFTFFKFYPMKEGFQVCQDGTVLLNVYANDEFSKMQSETKFAKMIKGTAYEEMAVDNSFSDINDDFIKKRDSKSYLKCNIVWRTSIFGLWVNEDNSEYVISLKHNLDTVTFCYTTKDYKPNMQLITDKNRNINKELKRAFQYGYLYFEDLFIRAEILDLFTIMGVR